MTNKFYLSLILISVLFSSELFAFDKVYRELTCRPLIYEDCTVTESNNCVGAYSLEYDSMSSLKWFSTEEDENALINCEVMRDAKNGSNFNQFKEEVLKASSSDQNGAPTCVPVSESDCRSASVSCVGGHSLKLNGVNLLDFSIYIFPESEDSCNTMKEAAEQILAQ